MDNASQSASTATLFYDGACPLCMKEMARLGRLKSDQLALADIHSLAPDPTLPDSDALLRTLHLRLPDGTLLTGVDANIAAWSYTPYGRWLNWLRWPGLRFLVERVYVRWARWRYERLYGKACPVERR
jgi:predicted DCC family thiol-disulfide oxidoreductase YuxK